jgi:hypothetical protein
MRLIIQAYLVDDVQSTTPVELLAVDRPMSTDTVGLTLAEGRALMASAQQYLVKAQCASIAAAHASCPSCDSPQSVKGWHDRQIRTVFGKVTVRSPRVRCCPCVGARPGSSYSPLKTLLPERMTPELEYLHVKWAALLPYATAKALLDEVLPLEDSVSVSSVKRRVRAVGLALEREAASMPEPKIHDGSVGQAANEGLASLAVDSAWLRHCDPPLRQGRHVNLVAGRAVYCDGRSRLYAYLHNQVPSAAARLDRFLTEGGSSLDERVTIVADGAGEFEKAVRGSQRPICRILDWFHIAMRFEVAQRSVFGAKFIDGPERAYVEHEIMRAKWLVWHGKAAQAVRRLHRLDQDLVSAKPEYEFGTFWINLHKAADYVRDNPGLVNYARRHRRGLPISSAIAESAVNEVVSHRMAKKQQMRWSDEGAHLLAQVRVKVLNDELVPRSRPTPWRPTTPSHDPAWDAYLMLEAA